MPHTIHDVMIDDLKRGLDDGSILLVDVREPHEFAMAHIAGSVNLPLSRFDPQEIRHAPGQRVVYSCAAGIRSLRAIHLAQDMGFDHDAHVPDGMRGWIEAGEPFARG